MQKITIDLAATPRRGYAVWVEAGLIGRLSEMTDPSLYSKVFVLADRAVQPVLDKLLATLPATTSSLMLAADEHHKDIATVQRVWTALHKAGCDRASLLINLGGGVTGDIGGFAASTYMRGIDFLNIPTTLLAQVDASVGGKTGFNFDGIKNLVGTFNQPVGVLVDPGILASLPEREFLSGFAEVIKHGLVQDAAYFRLVTAKPPASFSSEELTATIAQSIRIKAAIVQRDEAETGQRKLVNFGHTIGHAIEAVSHTTHQPLLHGEAVSLGMRGEALLSKLTGKLDGAELKQVEQALVQAGLPVTLQGMDIGAIRRKMLSDKKNRAGSIHFTLLEGIGHGVYDQNVDDSLVERTLELLRKAP